MSCEILIKAKLDITMFWKISMCIAVYDGKRKIDKIIIKWYSSRAICFELV